MWTHLGICCVSLVNEEPLRKSKKGSEMKRIAFEKIPQVRVLGESQTKSSMGGGAVGEEALRVILRAEEDRKAVSVRMKSGHCQPHLYLICFPAKISAYSLICLISLNSL